MMQNYSALPTPEYPNHDDLHKCDAKNCTNIAGRHDFADQFDLELEKFGSCVLTTYHTTQLLGPPQFWLKGNSKGNNQSIARFWHEVIAGELKQAQKSKTVGAII